MLVRSVEPTVTINNLNNFATIHYGNTLTLTVLTTDLPEGAYVKWEITDGSGVEISQSADGSTCDVTSVDSGTVTITAKVVDKDGNAIKDESGNEISVSQKIESNAGLIYKIVYFFRNLFGLIKPVVQSINKII